MVITCMNKQAMGCDVQLASTCVLTTTVFRWAIFTHILKLCTMSQKLCCLRHVNLYALIIK